MSAALLVAMNGAPASAMDLAQALAAARAKNPDLAVVVADGDAAAARLRRANRPGRCRPTTLIMPPRLRQAAAQAALEASAVSARSVAEEVAAAVRHLAVRLDSETRLANAERGKAEADRDVLVAFCRRQAVGRRRLRRDFHALIQPRSLGWCRAPPGHHVDQG